MKYKVIHEYFERMPMTKNEIYSMLNVLQYFIFFYWTYCFGWRTQGIEALPYVKFSTRKIEEANVNQSSFQPSSSSWFGNEERQKYEMITKLGGNATAIEKTSRISLGHVNENTPKLS